jgi:ribosome-associated translation inhibitor RaiA
MAASVEITFLGMTRSPSVEAQIQRWVAKLEKTHGRITHCATWIELPHRHGRKGNAFRVRIELGTPGDTLVSDQTHHDAHAAIGQAFRAARRQLLDHVRVQRGEVKRAALA